MIDNSTKIAVIFGVRNDASIAFHVAQNLQKSGCKVFIPYVQDTKEDVLHLLATHGFDTSLSQAVDVRIEEEIQNFLQAVYQAHGQIHYILHGVAFGNEKVMCYAKPGSNDVPSSYIDIPFEDLVDSFNISAYSLLRIARVAKDILAPGASILTLSYNASQKVFPGYAGMAINKAALENIMLYLADYFGARGVRVNAVSAGLVMTTSSGAVTGIRSLRKLTKNAAPLGNVTAQDVANAALYYFSDLSQNVTGNIHYVDGGFNIMSVPQYDQKN